MAVPVILSVAETHSVERAAISAGYAAAAMMEAAGAAAAAAIIEIVGAPRPTIVLCGAGGNGGDGFVVARKLKEAGWPVAVAALDEARLAGEAKLMASLYDGERRAFAPESLAGAGLLVDGIFGIGLARDVEGPARAMIEAANAHAAPVIALDIPSGVDADTGRIRGVAVAALATIAFIARKPGHLLFPGRALSGVVRVAPIGIEERHIGAADPKTFENTPALWLRLWPRPGYDAHKYSRGAVAVISGRRARTGAARLAAMAALRAGAGAVTVLSPTDALDENARHLTAIMLRESNGADDVVRHFEEMRIRAAVVGPGGGVGGAARETVRSILRTPARAVIDADAITSFAEAPDNLFAALRADDVLTPHEGEFARLFPDLADRSANQVEGKLARARAAAARAGGVVVIKGADTVIAAPDGRAIINANAPGELATAGAGDVLAGFVAAFQAQGLKGFEAAASAVWLHGACGQVFGPGLIAEDLPGGVPIVLKALYAPPRNEGAPA